MLSDHGENELVAALLSQLGSTKQGRGIIAGAGEDDCAVVKSPKETHRLLLKTDCVIEGVHFAPDTAPTHIGWKALCRPLSDIAATGGRPLHAMVTFAINREKNLDWAKGIYAGIGQAAAAFGVTVVGGETAATPGPCLISVCLTGSVRRGRHITRAGGRPGDLLFVTGQLGGSFPSGKHLHFRPRLAEGAWLARHSGVRAMMDLSDGLAADLPRLANASNTGYQLDPTTLPITAGCTLAQALSDGEDYELLIVVAPAKARKLQTSWREHFSTLPLTCIGMLQETGTTIGLDNITGYDHFSAQTHPTKNGVSGTVESLALTNPDVKTTVGETALVAPAPFNLES